MISNETGLLTVLVVDDFEDARYLLRPLLEINAYRVIEASDGEGAVEMAQRENTRTSS